MRTLDAILADALANQKGEVILRVLTWTDKAAYDAAPAVPEHTWQTKKFKIAATSASCELVTANDYTLSAFTVFIIERGVTYEGVEFPIQSGLMFVRKYEEDYGAIKLEGSSYPNQKITIAAGDGTYQEVIEAFCTEIGKTAVFKNATDTWLGYQFLPTGKALSLNKAEQIEAILKQKYTILVYEESPGNLVFYNQDSYPSSALKAIETDGTKLLAVATAGANGGITSTNATDWTPQTLPSFYNDVAYSPSLGLWVAVGASVAASSADGETWTARTIPAGTYNSIVWSISLALFVAVGNNVCATSANGTSWTARTIPTGNWKSVDWSSSLTLFTAVSDKIATSPDGTTWTYQNLKLNTWTTRTAANANTWNGICWSPELGLFCAVSEDGTYRMQTSPDGITWTQRTATARLWKSICWSPELGLFCAVANTASGYATTSPDGITWTEREITATGTFWKICWSPDLSLFCAVSSYGILTSPDGITWTSRHSTYTFTSVCWSPELGLFCARGGKTYTSTDGITWTETADGTTQTWETAWSPELGLFCSCMITGDFETSPDGTTWTARSSTGSNWRSICWSTEARLFVAVGMGTTYKIAYSPNGIDWTVQTATGLFTSVCYAPELDLFCAINNDATYRVITTTAEDKALNTVIWSSSLALFVGVGVSKCFTSTDGITWTTRTIPAGTYYGVTFGNNLLVAVGASIVATSPNGTTWTTRTPGALYNWQGVTWSDLLSLFIAVASNGTANIMSSPNGATWTIIAVSANFSLSYEDGTESQIIRDQSAVHYIWRDEAATIHTEYDTALPQWNLGFLASTDDPPTTHEDAYYKIFLKKAPVRLDITDSDKIHFTPYWSIDPTKTIDAMMQVIEVFDIKQSPSWSQEIRSIILFNSTEGGALPSTIERVAAYTPLVSTGFDGNLNSSVNNLQALANAVDDLPILGSPAWADVTGAVEGAQDAVGAMVADTATIDLTYTDATPELKADVKAASITEAMQVLADNTTQNVSTTKHGYAPKAPNNAMKFLDGAGAWTTPLLYFPFGVYIPANAFVPAGCPYDPYLGSIDRNLTLTKLTISLFPYATNNGSNYWVIKMRIWPTGTTLKQLNTSALTVNVFAQLTATTFDVSTVAASDIGIYITVDKVGTPGTLYMASPALIVTP